MKSFFVLTTFALFWEASSLFIICPDTNLCFLTHTCCPTSGGYGCCPDFNANCCDDFTCCASGYQCTGTSICVKELDEDDLEPTECKNNTNTYYCPPHSKCCPNEREGTDGCCLFSNPVHCKDGVHYCPPGTECSKSGNTCTGLASTSNSKEYALSLSLKASFNESSFKMDIPWLTKSKPLPSPSKLSSKHRN